jgi:vitamin B12/bleomycin/antimicrobial peptide transport system ATP-binding/permease protein
MSFHLESNRDFFSRVFIYKPDLIFLDEATSALDEENESHLYTYIRNMNCSYVSVGHRSTLLKYHHVKLTVIGNGKWKIEATHS